MRYFSFSFPRFLSRLLRICFRHLLSSFFVMLRDSVDVQILIFYIITVIYISLEYFVRIRCNRKNIIIIYILYIISR